MASRKIPPSVDEPAPIKSLVLLPWIHEAGDAALNVFVREAEVFEFPSGSVFQRAGGKYEGIFIIGTGTLLVKGQAGLIRCKDAAR